LCSNGVSSVSVVFFFFFFGVEWFTDLM